MALQAVLIDTDILSAIMRQHPQATANAAQYLRSTTRLTISSITRYEILRGLQAKQAVAQLAAFEMFCQSLEIVPIEDAIIVRAAEIYGQLHRTGQLIGDADILIGATCLEKGYQLASNNLNHFSRIAGLQIVDWLS